HLKEVTIAAALVAVVCAMVIWAFISIKKERDLAELNLGTAVRAVNELLRPFAAERLAEEPEMDKVRSDLLKKAEVYNETFLGQQGRDPKLRFEVALTCQLVADIHRILGEYDESEK